jgi:hypothetical protein
MNGSVLGTYADIIDQYHGWIAVKILFLIGIAVYVVFALTIWRQTQLMNRVLKINIVPSFKTLAFIYFLIAIGYFLLALLFL